MSSPVDEAVGAETAATIILGAMLVTKSKYFSLHVSFSLPPEEGRQAAETGPCRFDSEPEL